MAEQEELLKRLEALESQLAEAKGSSEKKSFMDKYGQKFSGDEGIGTAILAQLNRRGIDTSAADDAVQEIVENLRKDAQELMDKLNSISDAVEEATGKPPPEAPPDAGGAPPPDMGAPPPVDPAAGGAPPDAGGAPPPAPPPGVPSDIDLKEDIDLPKGEGDPDEALEEVQKDENLEGADEVEEECTGKDDCTCKKCKPIEELMDDFEEGDPDEEEDDEELVPFDELKEADVIFEEDPDIDLTEDEADFITKLLTRGGH